MRCFSHKEIFADFFIVSDFVVVVPFLLMFVFFSIYLAALGLSPSTWDLGP